MTTEEYKNWKIGNNFKLGNLPMWFKTEVRSVYKKEKPESKTEVENMLPEFFDHYGTLKEENEVVVLTNPYTPDLEEIKIWAKKHNFEYFLLPEALYPGENIQSILFSMTGKLLDDIYDKMMSENVDTRTPEEKFVDWENKEKSRKDLAQKIANGWRIFGAPFFKV